MAWIDVISEEDAAGDLAEQYSQLLEPWGGVDNILKIHSLNPASLQAHVLLYKTVMYGKSLIMKKILKKEELMCTYFVAFFVVRIQHTHLPLHRHHQRYTMRIFMISLYI